MTEARSEVGCFGSRVTPQLNSSHDVNIDVRIGSIQPDWPDGFVTMSNDDEPLVVTGHRMQLCFEGGRTDQRTRHFFRARWPKLQLSEYQQALKKSDRFGSGNTRFVLLDHRTGEVIDIAPWYGASANGDLTKAQSVERLLQRRQSRSQD